MAQANKLIPVVDGTAGTPIELTDSRIDINNPTNEDVLMYNSISGKFEANSIGAIVSDVAISGDYNDLNNTPAIPGSTSDLTNDSGFITINDVPQEVFVCNYDTSNNTMDKTPAEIVAAKAANKIVVCKLSYPTTDFLFLNQANSNPFIVFTGFSQTTSSTSVLTAKYHVLRYTTTDSWKFFTFDIQQQLVSGTNIKTINGNSILGSGDLTIGGGTEEVLICNYDISNHTMDKTITDIYNAYTVGKIIVCKSNTTVYYLETCVDVSCRFHAVQNTGQLLSFKYIKYLNGTWSEGQDDWNSKQDKLIGSQTTGQNIKTINGNSLLGSGDLIVGGGDANVQSDWNQTDNTADDYIKNKPTIPDVLEDLTDVVYDYEFKYIPNALTDYDGNSYGAVIIGNQVWMADNLRTTHNADGTAITLGTGNSSNPRYYNNTNSTIPLEKRGYLYNYFAFAKGSSSSNTNPSGLQGVAPTGWHIPSDLEFLEMENRVASALGGSQISPENDIFGFRFEDVNSAKALAQKDYWLTSAVDDSPGKEPSQNNFSQFGCVPTGRTVNAKFSDEGEYISLWTCSSSDSDKIRRLIQYNYKGIYRGTITYANTVTGYSVRCVYNGTPEQFIRTLMDKQVLVYDYSKQAWVNKNAAEALPSMSGNSGKVLAVNSGETGVEWVTQLPAVTSTDNGKILVVENGVWVAKSVSEVLGS